MNCGRLISTARWLLRQLSTEAAEKRTKNLARNSLVTESFKLYRRLSPLGKTGESMSQFLDRYAGDGNAISKYQLRFCIRELRKYRSFQYALQIMEWMEMKKIKYKDGDFALRLDLISKTKGLVAAENYFNDLPPQARNKSTYGSLLNCYCKENMEDKALSLFEMMNEFHYVSHLAFNNLMTLYMKLNQPEKVPLLVNDMKRRNIPMDAFTYLILMDSYGCLNDIAEVERVYEETKRVNKICWRTCSSLAGIYVKNRQIKKAESALARLEEEVKPGQRDAYHFLITLYAGICNPDGVYRVWNSLKSVSPVTNKSYHIMLQTLYRLDDIKGLTKCFREWESSCTGYDTRLAGTVISAYLSKDLFEEATLVFQDAIRRGKKPLFQIREMFMRYFLNHCQADMALYHLEAAVSEVKNNEWHPSPEVLSAFLKYFEEQKDVDGAEELRKILKTPIFYHSMPESSIPAGKSISKDDSEIDREFEELLGELHRE